MNNLLFSDANGLYCPLGDFYIDPWRPVNLALITHGHSDHLRWGHAHYLSSELSGPILKHKLAPDASIQTLKFGEKKKIGKVWVSFHPAGHILGSSQIRIESDSDVWVVSGDYKRAPDVSCTPFEIVSCETFITEATFGLPIYQWEPPHETSKKIFQWWQQNAEKGLSSVLFCYALGKGQRILSMLKEWTDQTVYVHGSLLSYIDIYRTAGIAMLPTIPVSQTESKHSFAGDLILAPGSAFRSPWMKRFPKKSTANASGWMIVRGNRRRQGFDRGFVLSDHADWNDLLQTVSDTGAKRILVTHTSSDSLSHYLKQQGRNAAPLKGYLLETHEEEG